MKIQHFVTYDISPDGTLGDSDMYSLITDDDGKVIRLDPPDLDHPLKRPTRRGLNRLLDDIEEIDVDAYRDDLNERNGGAY